MSSGGSPTSAVPRPDNSTPARGNRSTDTHAQRCPQPAAGRPRFGASTGSVVDVPARLAFTAGPEGESTPQVKDGPMSFARRFDHVGITVADLNTVTTFFVGLGLEVEGTRAFIEGEFLDTVIGIPDARTEIVMLRPPDGGTRLELSSFVRP